MELTAEWSNPNNQWQAFNRRINVDNCTNVDNPIQFCRLKSAVHFVATQMWKFENTNQISLTEKENKGKKWQHILSMCYNKILLYQLKTFNGWISKQLLKQILFKKLSIADAGWSQKLTIDTEFKKQPKNAEKT